MEIAGKSKRNLDRHLRGVPAGAEVVIALTEVGNHDDALGRAGFSTALPIGETVLPIPKGTVSTYNAEGTEVIHKDQPMETVYRQVQWTWEQWRGRHTETKTGIRDVPYQRYPRTFLEPPGVELTVAEGATGAKAIVAPALAYSDTNKDALLHQVNLFLDLFGQCSLLTEDLEPYLRVEVRRYNWDVLPPGEMPWQRLERRLSPILDQMGERVRPVAEHRLKMFTDNYPSDFTAVGRAGFSGYLIFGYEDKGVHVVESLQYGNATYVFGEDWQRLAQMTKAQILRNDLQQDRIIHRTGWDAHVRQLLA